MFGWHEIYVSTNKNDFDQAIKKLDDHKIGYRVKTKNGDQRLSINNLDGRQIALMRGMGGTSNNFFYIYVKKQDVEYSKEYLCI